MNISVDTENKVRLLLQQHRKLEAVKLVYETAHCGLKEAKDYVDSLQLPVGNEPPQEEDMDNTLLSLLAANKKIHAVKYYRDRTGKSLAESVQYVDALERIQKRSTPGNAGNTQIDKIIREQETNTRSQQREGSFFLKLCVFLIVTALAIYLLFFRS